MALDMWKDRGDIRDVLPVTVNLMKLLQNLNTGPVAERLNELLLATDAERELFLSNENNFVAAMRTIAASDTMMDKFLPCLNKHQLFRVLTQQQSVPAIEKIVKLAEEGSLVAAETLKWVLTDNMNKWTCKAIRLAMTKNVSETTDQ